MLTADELAERAREVKRLCPDIGDNVPDHVIDAAALAIVGWRPPDPPPPHTVNLDSDARVV